MFTSRTCVRSRAHAPRARGEAPACRMVPARAREVTLHLTLCFWFYSHKAFLGANIFFCRRFEWREVSISVWQYFSCCSLLPPLPFVPSLSSWHLRTSGHMTWYRDIQSAIRSTWGLQAKFRKPSSEPVQLSVGVFLIFKSHFVAGQLWNLIS